MKKTHVILGVHITDRLKNAVDVQKLLTEYGCNIKTRLGLHEISDDTCSMNGLLILEMVGDQIKSLELAAKLNEIEGIEVQNMVFEHNNL
ncbi:MAG: hypothetical protein Q7N50_08630 [Armatimonadota bacterium]|nr:hypothetical protein [Armatimonadota bacterium]